MISVASIRTAVRNQVRRTRSGAATASGTRRVAIKPEDARQRALRLDALVSELSETNAMAGLRLAILRHLDQFGPRLVVEIPRAWPVTREHVRAAANRLVEDGLLAVEGKAGRGAPRRLGLTQDGTRLLEEIDWTETIRLVDGVGES
jgi:hypothetical protein